MQQHLAALQSITTTDMRHTLKALLPLLTVVMMACHDDTPTIPTTPKPDTTPQPVALAATDWVHYLDTTITTGGVDIDYTYHHILSFLDDSTGVLNTHITVVIEGVGTDTSRETIPLTYVFDSLASGTLYLATQNTATGADTIRVVPFSYLHNPDIIRLDDGAIFRPAR